jgi:hypothetical protein
MLLSARLIELLQVALGRRVDSLQQWLALWTGIVALGLMWEYGAELAKLSNDWLERRRTNPASTAKEEGVEPADARRRFKWISWFLILGAVAVTAGVAGELFVEAAASSAETELRAITDSINVQERKDIVQVRERAANAELEAAQLRIALASIGTPRSLVRAAQERISKRLCRFKGQSAQIAYPSWVFDGRAFSEAIRCAVDGRGTISSGETCEITNVCGNVAADWPPAFVHGEEGGMHNLFIEFDDYARGHPAGFPGVHIVYTSDQNSMALALALAEALRNENVRDVETSSGLRSASLRFDSSVLVRVGLKPREP